MRPDLCSIGMSLLIGILLLADVHIQTAWAQQDVITAEETMTIFFIFIVAVIALFLYLARHSIFKRRTEYDDGNYESKKNRDYEKYHSGWQDDYEEYRNTKDDPNIQDYYKVLGVSSDATPQIIKSRYRKLAKTLHPDVSGDASDGDMALINEAYEVLSDKQRRDEYDRYRNGARGGI